MTLTRRDCAADLPEGTDPLIVDLHLTATAADRVRSRCQTVSSHARAWLQLEPDDDGAEARRRLRALLAIELGGTGGPMGFGVDGGNRTARMSWAARLGKGRRHASDGPAWDDAVRRVATSLGEGEVTPADVGEIAGRCGPDDLEWPLAYALRRAHACRLDVDQAALWATCARVSATLAEPDSGAGRLAARYSLRTKPRLRTASLSLRYQDPDRAADAEPGLSSLSGANSLIDELVEDFTGDPAPDFLELEEKRVQTWVTSSPDCGEAQLRITCDAPMNQYTVELQSRAALHPAALRLIEAAWILRHAGDEIWTTDVIVAHEAMTEMHPDMLRAERAAWDIAADAV
jgi:hypothetical protein